LGHIDIDTVADYEGLLGGVSKSMAG